MFRLHVGGVWEALNISEGNDNIKLLGEEHAIV